MDRRNFLITFILWVASFVLGYRIKDIEILRSSNNILAKDVTEDLDKKLASKVEFLTEDITVNIPSEFPSLQEAVDYWSSVKPSNNTRIIIRIESGHKLTKGLLVQNGDFGHFRIESEDEEVFLDKGNFQGPSESQSDPNGNLILGVNARMPVLACLINMEGIGHSGYHASHSSNGMVEPNCGVKNSAFSGLECSNSVVWAHKSIFTGCYYGYRAQQSGTIMAQNGNASDCISDGVLASRGSTIQFAEGNASNCKGNAVRAQRSRIVCMDSDLSNAGKVAVYATQASQITVTYANCKDAGEEAIYATDCSQVSAGAANCSNAGSTAIYANRASQIDADGANAKDCRSKHAAVLSEKGSQINAHKVDTTGHQGTGFKVTNGAFITCTDSIGKLSQQENIITANGAIFR